MKRKTLVSIVVAIMAIFTIASCNQGTNVKKINQIKSKAFNALVTDDVVNTFVLEFLEENDQKHSSVNRMSYVARHAVLNEHLLPAFGSHGECYAAMYCAYTIDQWEFRGLNKDLLEQPLRNARKHIMATAKKHLADPDNLTSFYESKRDVFIAAMDTMSESMLCRTNIYEKSRNAHFIFLQVCCDDSVRIILEDYNTCFEECVASGWSDYSIVRFRGMEREVLVLSDYSGDKFFMYTFAYRRYLEGGEELLSAYIDILRDISTEAMF